MVKIEELIDNSDLTVLNKNLLFNFVFRAKEEKQERIKVRNLIQEIMEKDEEFWEFERSSGYAGYRNKKTGEWIYEEDYFRRQKTKTVEEELLEQIKFALYCNNEAQAIRMLEQYKYYIQNEIRKTNNLL